MTIYCNNDDDDKLQYHKAQQITEFNKKYCLYYYFLLYSHIDIQLV